MNITGNFTSVHFIRLLLQHEYAATILFESGHVLKLAHRKGVWFFHSSSNYEVTGAEILNTMTENGVVRKSFAVTDTMELSEPKQTDSILVGLLQAYREKADKEFPNWPASRYDQAWILERILTFWGNTRQAIKNIHIHQSGRNASIDENGEFHFSARPNEFHI